MQSKDARDLKDNLFRWRFGVDKITRNYLDSEGRVRRAEIEDEDRKKLNKLAVGFAKRSAGKKSKSLKRVLTHIAQTCDSQETGNAQDLNKHWHDTEDVEFNDVKKEIEYQATLKELGIKPGFFKGLFDKAFKGLKNNE